MFYYSASIEALHRGSVTVEQAAKHLGVSTRRVRKLLLERRLAGERNGRFWRVVWPMQYTLAKRGPLLGINRKDNKPRPKRTLRVVNQV